MSGSSSDSVKDVCDTPFKSIRNHILIILRFSKMYIYSMIIKSFLCLFCRAHRKHILHIQPVVKNRCDVKNCLPTNQNRPAQFENIGDFFLFFEGWTLFQVLAAVFGMSQLLRPIWLNKQIIDVRRQTVTHLLFYFWKRRSLQTFYRYELSRIQFINEHSFRLCLIVHKASFTFTTKE